MEIKPIFIEPADFGNDHNKLVEHIRSEVARTMLNPQIMIVEPKLDQRDLRKEFDERNKQMGIKLIELIRHLDECHEKGDECINPETGLIVSNVEYDELVKQCDTISETPSLSEVPVELKVAHDPSMTSISKCSGTQEEKQATLDKWVLATWNIQAKCKFVQSLKMDGISLSLKYEHGILIAAGLRSGDGTYGENVIENVQWVHNIPNTLTKKLTCDIRGELYCRKSDFALVNDYLKENEEKLRSNARNHVAGAIRKHYDSPNDFMLRSRLEFISYSMHMNDGSDEEYYCTEMERSTFIQQLGLQHVELSYLNSGTFEEIDDTHRDLDFLIDGIVISVNDLAKQKELGHCGSTVTSNPRGKIAWKFKDDTAIVIIKNIVWQTGRTGKITPVLEFDPVELEGTQVARCTAHNYGIVKTEKLTIGCFIEIVKSGKIIPKFLKVVGYASGRGPTWLPLCPSCESQPIVENSINAVCLNPNCPAQVTKKYTHFLSSIGVKGIAESTVDKLLEAGLIHEFADFFKLKREDWISAGFSQRMAYLNRARLFLVEAPEKLDDDDLETLVFSIRDTLEIPVTKFIQSLGIPEAGKEFGQIVDKEFADILSIFEISVSTWMMFDGIGEITARNIVGYLRSEERNIQHLLKFIKPVFSKRIESALADKTFCFTGAFGGGKKKWQQLVIDKGGIVKDSVSEKLDYCVIGAKAGSKANKAEELGVTTLTNQELIDLLNKA